MCEFLIPDLLPLLTFLYQMVYFVQPDHSIHVASEALGGLFSLG